MPFAAMNQRAVRRLKRNLREAREGCDLTPSAAALKIGVAPTYIYQLENRNNSAAPSLGTLQEVARKYRTTMSALLEGC
jgi:DNA-binding XRE family transcriptional regulator